MKKVVSYVKESPALLPKSARIGMRESARLAKSVGVVLAWSVVATAGYLSCNTDQIPVEFLSSQGSVQDVGMQTIGDTERLTISLMNGEEETRFVRLGEVWVCPDDVSLPVSAGLSDQLDLVQQQYELDSSIDLVGREMKTFTVFPSLK